jgi:uncharacterized protein YndB with AHSA1/START domain
MSYAFTIDDEIDVDAPPEDVWRAITVGPRIDSWFMGRNVVEPRVGGVARTDVDGLVMQSIVTAWEPPRRFAYRGSSGPAADACMEFEWSIDARTGGGATVHFTHRGRLPSEDGEIEFEALKKGDPMYVRKLARYLEFFNGQTATRNLAAKGPEVADPELFWSTLQRALGLRATVREWDRVHATLDGIGCIDGVVDYVTPEFLGVRTPDGLYRFVYGPSGTVAVEHHTFAPHATSDAHAWQAWLVHHFA